MFVMLLRYVKPLEEVDAMRPRHAEYIDARIAEGRYLLGGRREPPEGGVIIALGMDEEAVRRTADADPYISSGVAEYELIPFRAGRVAPGIEADPPA